MSASTAATETLALNSIIPSVIQSAMNTLGDAPSTNFSKVNSLRKSKCLINITTNKTDTTVSLSQNSRIRVKTG